MWWLCSSGTSSSQCPTSSGNSTGVWSDEDFYVLSNYPIASGVVFLMIIVFCILLTNYHQIIHYWNRIRLRATAVANLLIRRQEPPVQPETHQPNVGPNPSVLPTIPAMTFEITTNPGRMESAPAMDCPICLGPIGEGETVRILSNCKHTFHLECIELWLQSHSSCPICRAEAAPSTSPALDLDVGEVLIAVNQFRR